MFKFKLYTILFFFLLSNPLLSNEKVFIKLIVDDNIITNIDINKEIQYLTILNPRLFELNKKKIYDIAKKSLINETIKKKEIEKFTNLNKKNPLEEKMLKDIYTKLNLNEDNFKEILLEKKSYSIEEIKKKLKIEIFWNDLIYLRFNKQIKIDKNELLKKIKKLSNTEIKEYSLSEIIFEKQKDQDLEKIVKNINSSISNIGFENTANIYSIADSSKFGGKIGSVKETNLSKNIVDKIENLKEGQHTDIIQIGNNFLILKIDEIKFTKLEIDQNKELNKMIRFETDNQLKKFSKIYFNKSKMNYRVYEN